MATESLDRRLTIRAEQLLQGDAKYLLAPSALREGAFASVEQGQVEITITIPAQDVALCEKVVEQVIGAIQREARLTTALDRHLPELHTWIVDEVPFSIAGREDMLAAVDLLGAALAKDPILKPEA